MAYTPTSSLSLSIVCFILLKCNNSGNACESRELSDTPLSPHTSLLSSIIILFSIKPTYI